MKKNKNKTETLLNKRPLTFYALWYNKISPWGGGVYSKQAIMFDDSGQEIGNVFFIKQRSVATISYRTQRSTCAKLFSFLQ